MSDINLVASDTAPSIVGTLTNVDGTAFDLTGATVRFQMRLLTDLRFTVDASAVITNAAGGLVRYDWAAGNLATPGDYEARWKITFSGGTVEHTVPANTITVEAQ